MDSLSYPPRTLKRYIPFVVNDYAFTFLEHMEPYCDRRDLQGIYLYLNSLEDFQYKNIWNRIHERWSSLVAQGLQEIPTAFKRSIYYKDMDGTEYIHQVFTDASFDRHLRGFIGNDMLQTIFVMEQIIRHARL